MSRDFTLQKAEDLFRTFLETGYEPVTLADHVRNGLNGTGKRIVFRHDVDRKVDRALQLAVLQNRLGVRASYYFRFTKKTFVESVIVAIAKLGHEVGYHYEVLAKTKGDTGRAIELFKAELDQFRRLVPVDTICMHGSPLSRWDSKDLWKSFDYREFGLIAEPYLDLDFRQTQYLTDTGRSWNCRTANLRDLTRGGHVLAYRTSNQLIEGVRTGQLKRSVLMNMHPNRWCDQRAAWACEFAGQSLKNVVKSAVGAYRSLNLKVGNAGS